MQKSDDLTHGLGTSPSLHTVIISYARADASRVLALSSVTTLDHLLSLTLLDPVDLGSVWLKSLSEKRTLNTSGLSTHISTSPAFADMVEERAEKR